MENKRGQGLSRNAIILIILGVVVLVIMMIGFYAVWGTLAPWLSTDNVDTVIGSCQTACSTQSVFSYCSKERDLKTGKEEIKTTCYLLERLEEFERFKLKPCAISCNIKCSDVSVIIDGEKRTASLSTEACAGAEEDISNLVTDADGVNTYCCLEK